MRAVCHSAHTATLVICWRSRVHVETPARVFAADVFCRRTIDRRAEANLSRETALSLPAEAGSHAIECLLGSSVGQLVASPSGPLRELVASAFRRKVGASRLRRLQEPHFVGDVPATR